jgi:hypothetical protein
VIEVDLSLGSDRVIAILEQLAVTRKSLWCNCRGGTRTRDAGIKMAALG